MTITHNNSAVIANYLHLCDIQEFDKADELYNCHPTILENYQSAAHTFSQLNEINDFINFKKLLAQLPLITDSSYHCRYFIHSAALRGNLDFVRHLVESGVDINSPQETGYPSPPLASAVNLNHFEIAKWLVDHGAIINFDNNLASSYCPALAAAIRSNNLSIVKLLVEAGAALNVVDKTNRTPLGWAIDYNQKSIEDFLRVNGAIESKDGLGYREPEKLSPFAAWINNRVCESRLIPISDGIQTLFPLKIRAIEHENFTAILTDGLSEQALQVPVGQEAFRFVELVMLLPTLPTEAEMSRPQFSWMTNWLIQLAQLPFQQNTWFGEPISAIQNGDPPEPLSQYTQMTSWLCCSAKPPLKSAKLSNGKTVMIYTLLPLYQREHEFAKSNGFEKLLRLFAASNVPEHIDVDRPCVIE